MFRKGTYLSAKKLTGLEKGITTASNVLSIIGAVLLFAMMMEGAIDVIGRYLLNHPLTGTAERSQVWLGMMVFLSWGHAQIAKAHVNVELFFRRFPPRAQAVLSLATTFISLVLFILIAWQSVITSEMYRQGGRLIFVIKWPLAPLHLTVTLGAVVLCLVFVMDLIYSFRQLKGGH